MPESKQPFRQKKSRQGDEYQASRHVEDYWGIYRKGTYLEKPRRQGPGWLLPLLVFLLIVALVFWLVPLVISRLQQIDPAQQDEENQPVATVYNDSYRVAIRPVADLFYQPDLRSLRKSQVLYNEPVQVLSEDSGFGFVEVMLQDRTQGYMLSEDLGERRESIEPNPHSQKIIITAPTKRVMSHASRGTLVAEVLMGTVLYADYAGDSLFRVTLPQGQSGWLSSDGVIALETDAEIERLDDGARYFSNSALAFNQVTVLENGQSIRGASLPGVARIASFVNGVTLPRDLAAQSLVGQAVLEPENEEGLAIEALTRGDLIFFSGRGEDAISDMALSLGAGQILYAFPEDTAIRLYDLSQYPELVDRITVVRRIFP